MAFRTTPQYLVCLLFGSVGCIGSTGCGGGAGSGDEAGTGGMVTGGGPSSGGAGGVATGGGNSGGGDSEGTGGESSTGGQWSGDSGDTEGCPIVPLSRVVPIVGPFFSGPNPGPCSSSDGETFVYEGGLLSSSTGVDYTYHRDAEGRITSFESFDDSGTYTYSPGEILYQSTFSDDDQRMILDERGYVQEIYLERDGVLTGVFEYVYEECRLVRRDVVTAPPTFETTTYEYDQEGNLIARGSDSFTTTFDYSCW